MDRNNGRYPYIRRQGSGGHQSHNNHHHHNSNSNSNSSSSSSSSSSSGSNSQQYSNNSNSSINNSTAAATTTAGNAAGAATSYGGAAAAASGHQNVPLSQHDELIRYIREAWNKVSEQGTYIYCNESDNQLKNFKPFNLEEYWGQRLVQNIHVTTTHAGGHQ